MRKFCVILISIMFLLVPIFGCVSSTDQNNTPTSNDVFMKVAIQYPVIKYMTNHQNQTEKAEELIGHLRTVINLNNQITLSELRDEAYTFIPWEQLAPEDRLLLTVLLDVVQEQLNMQIGEGILDESDLLFLATFLDWMEQAIIMSKN